MRPDLALFNGVVRTLDPEIPVSSAVAIWGGRVVALGDDSLRREVSTQGQAIDLRGRLVLPGFVDAHVHFVEYALQRQRVDLSGLRSLEAALKRIKGAVERTPPGQWILGCGWDSNSWEESGWPDKHHLDRITWDHPIALDSKDLHSLWVNSLALQQGGIDDRTPDPHGGKIWRRPATGEAIGILSEMPAKQLVRRVIAEPSPKLITQAVDDATESFWQMGVTGIHDCEDAVAFATFQRLRQQGLLGLRVLMHLDVRNLEAAIQTGVCSGLGDEWLSVGGVKIFMDGSLGSRTGFMLEPYIGEPDNYGVVITSQDALAGLLERALPNNISATIHAIGDAANRAAIDELARALARYPSAAALRHRIEHAQLLSDSDIPRLGQHHVIASVQPLHATSDYEMVNCYWGEPRGQGAYPFKSLLNTGTPLAFGSDCPVEPCDPLRTLYAAVTRRRPDGSPGPEGWHPHERLTIEEALEAHITGPAYAAGEETRKGSLVPGKLADLVVLSQDFLTLDPEALLETQVQGTVVDGHLVYRSLAWD